MTNPCPKFSGELPDLEMASKHIPSYQQNFADYFGATSAFAFWKGRVALYTILKSLGVGPGDEVILPGYTCVMDVNPIKYLGAMPRYVDIEPQTYNLNVELLEDTITPCTKAIIAQHTYGYLVDMDRLMAIAAAHNIPVIEDCCLSLGSRYRGKLAGTMGLAAYFSTQWNKPYTTGLGGMAITSDAELAATIQRLCESDLLYPSPKTSLRLAVQLAVYRAVVYPRTTMFIRRVFRYLMYKGLVVASSSLEEKHKNQMPADFFMGASCVQARAGISQLKGLEKNLAHRRRMTQLYDELLAAKGWSITEPPAHTDPVLVRYPVCITEKWPALEQSPKCGVELGSWFESPLHPKETDVQSGHYQWGMCPQAEKAAREVVNLPVHPRVSESTVRRTVEFITQYRQAR